MAAPVLVRLGNEGRIDTAGIVVDRSLHGFNHLYGEPVGILAVDPPDPLAPCGGAAAFDRAAFRELGGFDPAFFAYLEDVDLGIRCVARGWRCRLAPTAIAIHAHSGTLGEGSPAKNRLTGGGGATSSGSTGFTAIPASYFGRPLASWSWQWGKPSSTGISRARRRSSPACAPGFEHKPSRFRRYLPDPQACRRSMAFVGAWRDASRWMRGQCHRLAE